MGKKWRNRDFHPKIITNKYKSLWGLSSIANNSCCSQELYALIKDKGWHGELNHQCWMLASHGEALPVSSPAAC